MPSPVTAATSGSKSYPADVALRERDERLEALKLIVGKLAHDFNNFLVPMLGYVTLIKEELSAGSPASTYADTMETAARKTEGHLENLLLTVRPTRNFHPKPTNFRQLVESVLVEWKTSIPENAHVSASAELCDCLIDIDEQQWRKALQQLLNNARFALATGGNLRIILERVPLSVEEGARLNVQGPDVFKLVISDDGFGMPKEVLRRAFDPFFSTRVNAVGGGLGLTLVHSVAQVHGGQIVLESAEDHGTTVTILLPTQFAVQPQNHFSRSETLPQNPRRNGSKILLVEDDPLVREVIKACLQKTKLEVCVGQDGEQGLRLFKKHMKDLALVVSDVTMPKMSGIELFAAIREIDPNMRIILVSGDAEGTREAALTKLGDERPLLIKKPFTLKSFNEVIRAYLA
jgi:two-component system cell cycle sensor histidine kinase/response regulator CckA